MASPAILRSKHQYSTIAIDVRLVARNSTQTQYVEEKLAKSNNRVFVIFIAIRCTLYHYVCGSLSLPRTRRASYRWHTHTRRTLHVTQLQTMLGRSRISSTGRINKYAEYAMCVCAACFLLWVWICESFMLVLLSRPFSVPSNSSPCFVVFGASRQASNIHGQSDI